MQNQQYKTSMLKEDSLRDKVIVITGGGTGLGKAMGKYFVELGADLIIASRKTDVLEATAKELSEINGGNILPVQCDVTDYSSVENLLKISIDKFGRVDVLINNAGIIRDNVIWKMPVEDFDKVIDINLKGTWLMCKVAGTLMREQKSGRIVNIASRAWLGNRGQSNYSASKAGVVGLTRVLALELGKYGVFVNAVAPGLIDTPLTQNLPKDIQEKLIQAQPTKSIGQPQDIANTVAFLCNEKTQFITGQTIYVDGGKSIGAGI